MMREEDSTPWKIPRPDIGAALSSGKLSRKHHSGDMRRSLPLESSPRTPVKTIKSKTILPSMLSPFSLSPLSSDKSPQTASTPSFSIGISSAQCDERMNKAVVFKELESNDDLDVSLGREEFDEMHQWLDYDSEEELQPDPPISPPIVCSWKCPEVAFLDIEYFISADYPAPRCFHTDHSFACRDHFEDNYAIIGCIGKGSFSCVYKVRRLHDDRVFALKIGKFPYTGIQDRYHFPGSTIIIINNRASKIEEVRNMWTLNNCVNICRIESSWEQNGILYILSEYCHFGRYILLFLCFMI